jgi:hypothetical protein
MDSYRSSVDDATAMVHAVTNSRLSRSLQFTTKLLLSLRLSHSHPSSSIRSVLRHLIIAIRPNNKITNKIAGNPDFPQFSRQKIQP